MEALIKMHTIEDIYALPDGSRAELIDGKIYDQAAPSRIHQGILHFLDRAIGNYIQSHKSRCKVYPAPFAVVLVDDKGVENYVEPDISVICDRNKLTDSGCNGAPNWIVEIVSPSSRKMDYSRKQALYADVGVSEYWIVDPLKKTVMVYRATEEWTPTIHKFSEKVESGLFSDLEINFSEADLD